MDQCNAIKSFAGLVVNKQSEESKIILKLSLEHGHRVGEVAYNLSKLIDLKERECIFIKIAGIYHDVGKCKIPYEIFNKPGRLSDEEYKIMKGHVIHSYNILLKKKFDKKICEIVKQHHEDFCGTGYPDQIKGYDITVGARIIRICDMFDALTHPRVYREILTGKEAIIKMSSSKHINKFDPDLFEIFQYMLDKNNQIL